MLVAYENGITDYCVAYTLVKKTIVPTIPLYFCLFMSSVLLFFRCNFIMMQSRYVFEISYSLFSHNLLASNLVTMKQKAIFPSTSYRCFTASSIFNNKKSNTRNFLNHLYHERKNKPVHQKHQKVYKDKSYSEYLYGRSVCQIAMENSKRPIFKVLAHARWQLEDPDDQRVSSILRHAASRNIPIEFRHPNMLFNITDGRPHQGVCLEVGQLPISPLAKQNFDGFLSDLATDLPLCVFLCDVKDPMNVGAILRTCHFVGVDKVIMTPQCSPITATASKASSGAAEVLPLYSTEQPLELFQCLAQANWDIIGTEAIQENEDDFIIDRFDDDDWIRNERRENKTKLKYPDVLDISQIKVDNPSLLVLGSEGSGIPLDLKAVCNKLVTIEQQNKTSYSSCLNVSTAAAIILHHLVAQQRRRDA